MTKTTCDICGKEMPTSIDKGNNFRISTCGVVWDICSNCREELNKWLESKKPKGEQKMSELATKEIIEETENHNLKAAANKIWDICKESPEMGNAVMDLIGEDAYQRVMIMINES